VEGRASQALPIFALALSLALALALWVTGPVGPDDVWAPLFLRGYAAAWLCYLAAAVIVNRTRSLPRWVLVWIVVAAVGMRLIALERTPPLSTDVWRYLWDGRVASAGINPFRFPPEAPELRQLRDSNWRNINYRSISTIYPPAAQLLFTGLARLRDGDAEAFRWAFAFFDIGIILALLALLRRTGRPLERVIWYAWCPLAITEVTAGAHVDAFALFLFLLALLATDRMDGKPGLASGCLLAASVMAKGYALLALPFFLRRGGWRFSLAFIVSCTVLLLPYLGAGPQLFMGLRTYLAEWQTNASVFLLLDKLLARVTETHFGLARGITMGLVLIVVGALVWRQKPGLEWLLGASFAAFGAQLFLSAPTLPWYALWLAPALCWWAIPGVALFTLMVSAQYYARWLNPGDQAAQFALLWAGYLPVYALLLGQLIWWRRRSDASHTP
jgi:hypothetical protein